MKSTKKKIDNGMLSVPMKVENREFNEFQLHLLNRANSYSKSQKLKLALFSLQAKLEDYLNANENETEIISVGNFIRLYIKTLGLKQYELAEYLDLQPSNFNKILSDERKLNFELSHKFSQLFLLDPKIWIYIQVKNDYIKFKNNRAHDSRKFRLEDLIKAQIK